MATLPYSVSDLQLKFISFRTKAHSTQTLGINVLCILCKFENKTENRTEENAEL